MNLQICTLTGASSDIPIDDLIARSEGRPWLEWGFLWSPKRQNSGRYPSAEWVLNALEALSARGIPTAVHLCGDSVKGFLAGLPGEGKLIRKASRVQLNFSLSRDQIDLGILDLRIDEILKPVITQHNPANLAATKLSAPNHQLLFDSSGGRGVSPADWLAPVPGKFCGYAGGLGPHNLEVELERIARVCAGRPFAIDMEGSLRTPEDRFDLAKVDAVLRIVDAAFAEIVS